jgi:hypothetical protein
MEWALIVVGALLVLVASTALVPIFPWGLIPSIIGGLMVGRGVGELMFK